jgi:sigma-E factor negative regulatory protein RseB
MLITAVATVTLPGVLAMLAVVGHEHVSAAASATATALDGTLTGPFPVAPATARAAVRNNVASVQRASGAPVTVLSRVTVSQQVMGMHILDGAADAGLSTSYQGTELVSQSGVDGSVKTISRIWHQSDGQTLVQTLSGSTSGAAQSTTADSASSKTASPDPISGSPEGVFGVTKSLMVLLGKHYIPVYRGGGVIVGRAATVIELYRFDGSLAARYWLDKQTKVPLRRDLFDASDNMISEDSFLQIKFTALALPGLSGAANVRSQAEESASPSAWVAANPPARFLTSLAGQGWQVLGSLPGGLPLYAAASTQTTSGEVVDLEYSDGLYEVSLFVQPGSLSPQMTGWRPVEVNGQQAFVSGRSITWAGAGLVYTMIADAPAQTVSQVVGALPGSDSPGVLDRLGRGFIRIAHAINPFG